METPMPVEDMNAGMPKWMKSTDGLTKKINNASGDKELQKIVNLMEKYGLFVPHTLRK
jgi:hypothetical protein